jgi:putative DNA primase/helicase
MRTPKQIQPKPDIELTRQGVFLTNTPGGAGRKKIAAPIRLRAIGKKADGTTMAQIRFRTMHGDYRSEFFAMSNLLPKNRGEIKNKLADLGYEWPEDGDLTSSILQKVATSRPKREFRMVSAPGWYDSAFVLRNKVFAPGNKTPEIYIDPKSDAHVGAFALGEGSLKDWQEFVAKPSRQSSCLRLSIAAALAAPFLRPLGLDSFGINWFSDTSDGKTTSLVVAASVPGLVGPEGLPGWADSEPALEALLRGCRDCPMALDESGDGEHQMRLDKKARRLAFLIARNRPRKLSKVYERNNGLESRETRNIVLSSSERALGQIARAAGKGRLGGEELRLIDIPASDPTSSGIIDGTIRPAAGKTLRETTKELVETLKASAIKHQGYAFRELLEKYVNDPHRLERRAYKEQFEQDAVLSDKHNAHYRVRSNFAVMYAAAALSIDYGILPWKKRPTFRAIEKCMRLALATMATGPKERAAATPAIDTGHLGRTLKKRIADAELVIVKPKQRVTEAQARARQKADGFKINGEIYMKPDRFKRWVPTHRERAVLKEQKVILTERDDTVERKIGGIKGKPRYYAINFRAVHRLASE